MRPRYKLLQYNIVYEAKYIKLSEGAFIRKSMYIQYTYMYIPYIHTQ